MAWGRQLGPSLASASLLRTADNVLHVARSALLNCLSFSLSVSLQQFSLVAYSLHISLQLSLSLSFCLSVTPCILSPSLCAWWFLLGAAFRYSFLPSHIFHTLNIYLFLWYYVDCFLLFFFFFRRRQTFEWHWLRCASMCLAKCVYS